MKGLKIIDRYIQNTKEVLEIIKEDENNGDFGWQNTEGIKKSMELLKEIKKELLILDLIMKNCSIEKRDIMVNYNKTPVIVKDNKYLKVDISEYGKDEELRRIEKFMEEYNESINN